MNRKHVARQTQRERNCSPFNGTERRTSARIARVGVSALIAGQLMMPGMSLAAEATGQNAVQTNSTATVAAEEAAPAPAREQQRDEWNRSTVDPNPSKQGVRSGTRGTICPEGKPLAN